MSNDNAHAQLNTMFFFSTFITYNKSMDISSNSMEKSVLHLFINKPPRQCKLFFLEDFGMLVMLRIS